MKEKESLGNYFYTKKVHEASTTPSDDFLLDEVTTSKEKKVTESFVIVKINNNKFKSKLDTGTEVNVISSEIYTQKQAGCRWGRLQPNYVDMEELTFLLWVRSLSNVNAEEQ